MPLGHEDGDDVAEVESGVAVVGGAVFSGNELSTAGGECGGVVPGLGGVVQDRDAVGGADLEPPVGVQQQLEAVGVQQGVVPAAQEHEVVRAAVHGGDRPCTQPMNGVRDAAVTLLLALFCCSSWCPAGRARLVADRACSGTLIGWRASLR
jgi:hypothetical protein